MRDSTGNTSTATWTVLLHDNKLCEEVVTAILVQFKQRQKRGAKAGYNIDEKEIHFFLILNTSVPDPDLTPASLWS